ncbi:hypothetical protein GL213_07860 [Halogeometricum borinquense]|uniref:Uncharacterized protein n=2 Tax=Halogeometricum borinquense TaxID=60847 RepID=A0A6C0UHA7_9EURY|nr:hypothetical protein [Halogeometricum borinquense]QIB74610.1 hypothetical protein G3I44_10135 [Halogeometricum borinquense]QIQ76441.1 hypothetical protein GL213_07860 [Halogeometricum borinquense]
MTMSANAHTSSNRLDRTAVGYALLFSVPMAVGITLMMLKVVGGPLSAPLVFAPGVVVAAAVFLFVVVAAARGEPD